MSTLSAKEYFIDVLYQAAASGYEESSGSISVHTVGHPAASGSYKQLRFSKGGHGVKKLIYRISAAIVVAGIIIMKRRTQRT